MTAATDLFVEDARGVSIEAAAQRLGLAFSGRRTEHAQPCPACGGTDTFAFNTQKNAWNCRHGGAGGKDAIGMAAHCLGLDLARRDGLLEACAAVLGQPVPNDVGGGEAGEGAAGRAERLARIDAQRQENARQAAARDAAQADFRERERERARGIYAHAAPIARARSGSVVQDYLALRGIDLSFAFTVGDWIREDASLTYWHGTDGLGRARDLHAGPAMVLPFLAPDLSTIGCHQTWIDLNNPPKYRPALYGDPAEGRKPDRASSASANAPPEGQRAAASGAAREALPTKKMRGSKKGGLIPLSGHPDARRWVGAEGIENTLAFAGWEGFRPDTFYFAAGDLGNLSGPADPASRFAHPTLTKADRNGVDRPVMVAGPVPLWRHADPTEGRGSDGSPGDVARPAGGAGDAVAGARREADQDSIWIGAAVTDLVLLADGDSERVMTAAAMVRARARHARPGRKIFVVWPKPGFDMTDIARRLEMT